MHLERAVLVLPALLATTAPGPAAKTIVQAMVVVSAQTSANAKALGLVQTALSLQLKQNTRLRPTAETAMILILRRENGVCVVLLARHPHGILLEILSWLGTAVDILPSLGVDARDLVGADANHFSVLLMEGLDSVDEGALLHGSHVGETRELP